MKPKPKVVGCYIRWHLRSPEAALVMGTATDEVVTGADRDHAIFSRKSRSKTFQRKYYGTTPDELFNTKYFTKNYHNLYNLEGKFDRICRTRDNVFDRESWSYVIRRPNVPYQDTCNHPGLLSSGGASAGREGGPSTSKYRREGTTV
jgi:hypothetical protein